MCSAPTCHVRKVRPVIDSPHIAVISRRSPEYQYPWFRFYWASNFYCMAIAADSSSPTGPPSAADWVAASVAAASETSVAAAAVVASAPIAVVAAADSIITRGIRCAGAEEVAAIDLLQRALSPRRAIAKLLALPGGGVVGNGGLRQRPRPEGVAREEDGEQVRQGEEGSWTCWG